MLAIKAFQEQQLTIQGQQETINTLESRLARLEVFMKALASNKPIDTPETNGISLEQNHPNTFNQSTTIRYRIPAGADAQIKIYDALGNLVRSIPASASGQVQVHANGLKVGTYTYTLIVEGLPVATKKMFVIN